MYDRFYPGKVWLDTEGKRIQAHGGSVIFVDDTFYWYGENKEKTDGKSNIWHWGVRCYSSKDLYNWKDEGIIIEPQPQDPTSPMYPEAMMDRPHILYNAKTKKYVAWLKIMGDFMGFAVFTADSILGPYELVNPCLRPCGMTVGDFDLDVEPADGKGYVYSERPHINTYCADLNEDYTGTTGMYSEHFAHVGPPDTREATAHFKRKGKHYLLTSGTTGYHPNPSEAAIADFWHGPYTLLGNPHVNDPSMTSFNSQISCVFKHPYKKDLYIACADRWLPHLEETEGEDFANGNGYRRIADRMRKVFDPDSDFTFTEEDAAALRINSAESDYVWLPLRFDGDMVYIDWLHEWKIEDFD